MTSSASERLQSSSSKPVMTDQEYLRVLTLREGMNNGGKRRHSMERILRDYTPNSPLVRGEMR